MLHHKLHHKTRHRFHLFRLELALGSALLIALLSAVLPFARECDDLRSRVLRLHILAHSDEAVDQALKLQVRDQVLDAAGELFLSAESRADAEAALMERLPELEAEAEALLRAAGYPYQVRGELTDMHFTTRVYDGGTLPAGTYRALRLTIGSGRGQNWWCVMFPPMCLSAAVTDAAPAAAPGDVLTPAQLDIIRHPEDYEVRLKVVEWWTGLQEWLRAHFSDTDCKIQ